ncbi:nurim homolog [Anoplophora glabripennis]|uniref:nurim homolog n=1 Tax=Anoplophora glabripennis TaxID=217634 RepID=UPI00087428AE|nr:nurim homolog [Anoplophora glabripennis]XP_018578648.1 nurim homolog [Anoplophora glabripennis]
MGLKVIQILYDALKIGLCLFGTVAAFFTVIDLTYFLCIPNGPKNDIVDEDPWINTSWALLVNMILLTLFILQHSLLASSNVKNLFKSYGLQVIFRSIYVITTSTVLMVLVKYWISTHHVIIWEYNLKYKPVLLLYSCIHVVAWIIIYVGNICTDVTELLGIKQVYYSLVRLPDPNIRKSSRLQRLTAHMRHPSFLSFILIFWLYPVMSLDRLLLASVLTSYMYIAWNPDERDYYYHKSQYERKYHELDHLHRYNY